MKNRLIGVGLFFAAVTGAFGFSCVKGKYDRVSERKLTLLNSKLLPDDLEECSAVEMYSDNLLWMINDSHNTNELFLVGIDGEIKNRIKLNTANNTDWEDLTCDKDGKLFVGDFGNNDNDREDLVIYIVDIKKSNVIEGLTPEVIKFTLEDQHKFPPNDAELHFDIEAFFTWNEELFLFTKDRSEPCKGLTKMYKIPAVAGQHEAKLMSVFYTKPEFYQGAITSADISSDGKKVVLLSNENVWLFSNYKGTDFLSGTSIRYELKGYHQYEGVVFKNDSCIYVTNELNEDEEVQLRELKF